MANESSFPNGIDVEGGEILNVADPLLPQSAMTLNYIDTKVMPSNFVLVKSLSDFPAPVLGIIDLVDNVDYEINGTVVIGTNQIRRGVSNKIFGLDKSSDKLVYTGTGAMFVDNPNQDISISFLTLANITAGSTLFAWTGSTNNTQVTDCIFGSCASLGSITGGNIVVINNNLISNCSEGITISGTINQVVLADNIWDANTGTITCLSVPSGTFNNFKISRNLFDVTTGQTALNLSISVTTNGAGIIEICDFTGLGTYVVQSNFLSPVWSFRANRGIQNTLTFIPRAYDRSFFSVRATNGTRISSGITTSAFASSATQSNDNQTNYTRYTSGASIGSFAGIESTSFAELRSNYSPIYSCVIKTNTLLTNCRIFVGFLSATLVNADDQTGAYAVFRYSSVAGDTGWRAIVDTGSVNTISSNIGTVTADTQYKFEIQIDFVNGNTYFRVNGGSWTVINSIPPSGTPLGICAELVTTTASARRLYFSRLDGNHN